MGDYGTLYEYDCIYMNDLINDLNSMNLGVDINGRRVCCLLYADDIVIFCNTESHLQMLLDRAHRCAINGKCKLIMKNQTLFIFDANVLIDHHASLNLDQTNCLLLTVLNI